MALPRGQAQTVRDGASCHKIGYVEQVKDIINFKGYLNGLIVIILPQFC